MSRSMTIMKDVFTGAYSAVKVLFLAFCVLLVMNVVVSVPLMVDFGLCTVYAAEFPVVKGRPTVGVYKITANHPDAADMAIEALTSAIGRLSSVRTMERAKLRQAFSEELLRREGIVTAVRRGHALAPDVDYLILGDVQAYYQPVSGGRCQMNLRLVDCSNDIGITFFPVRNQRYLWQQYGRDLAGGCNVCGRAGGKATCSILANSGAGDSPGGQLGLHHTYSF